VPNLNVVVAGFLYSAVNQANAARGSAADSIVNAALGQYFQTTGHRLYQISTAAALVEGVFQGAAPKKWNPTLFPVIEKGMDINER